jgi:hypothetical protein
MPAYVADNISVPGNWRSGGFGWGSEINFFQSPFRRLDLGSVLIIRDEKSWEDAGARDAGSHLHLKTEISLWGALGSKM